MPQISIIMGVYNQFNKEELLQAINSILNQSFKDFEFIIYDDGSEPEVREFLREVEKIDKRIVLISHKENHGLAFSLNVCIRAAKGKYIARMDADDISYIDRLKKQKEFLDENIEYAWVGCNIELCDENGVWGRRKMPEKPKKLDFLRYSPYAHPTVMYRAEIFERNQGYIESKEMLRCEDYEIFMRLSKAGFKGANIQEYLFCYREDKDSYKKRKVKYRINEAKCRYRNFKSMGILFPVGWMFVLRPIVACFIPSKLLAWAKHRKALGLKEINSGGVNANEKKDNLNIDKIVCDNAGSRL